MNEGVPPQPQDANGPGIERPRVMDDWERQQVFRDLVIQLLRNGPLSSRRRQELVRYAAMLGINGVLAGRLVRQARNISRESPPPEPRYEACTALKMKAGPRIPSTSIVAIGAAVILLAIWVARAFAA